MPGRLICCLVLTAAACGLPRTVCAQAYPWARGSGNFTAEMPASVAASNPYAGQATYYPTWGQPPYGGGAMWPNDTVDGDAFGNPGHLGYPDAYGMPLGSGVPAQPGQIVGGPYGSPYRPAPGYHDPSFPPGPGVHPNGNTTYEMLPPDRGLFYDEDIAHLRALRGAMRGAFFRTEYLSWQMENPGNTLLGAPLAGTNNPRQPFIVQADDGTGNIIEVGTARVMDMSPVDLRNMQGVRSVLGLPYEDGEFNLAFYGIQAVAHMRAPELLTPASAKPTIPDARFIATSLLNDGTPDNLLVLYDRDFQAKYKVTDWGAEANFFYDLREPADGWRMQGMFGFRHTSHLEELIQRGSFDNSSGLDTTQGILANPVNNLIYSETRNRLYGAQFGLRSELTNKYFSVGFEPKVAFSANRYYAEVMTDNLRDYPGLQDDGRVRTSLNDTIFSPTIDLGVYARVNLNETWSLYVGYNAIWMNNIARADNVIRYDDRGALNPPHVVVQRHEESLWMHGLSVGGQITLP